MNSTKLFDMVSKSTMDEFVVACLGVPGYAALREESQSTLLHAAVAARRSDLAIWLMHNGCGANTPGEYDYTPLHMAAVRGLMCVAIELIKLGADVHAAECEGQTPLHKACLVRNRNLAQMLIDAGADVNARDTTGATPLELLFEDRRMARFIISYGGSLSEPSRVAA